MKKLLITLIVFASCSKDTVFEPILEDENCNCKINLVQVTTNGIHLVRGVTNVSIDCDDNGFVFARKYSSSNKLIQYKIYKCD